MILKECAAFNDRLSALYVNFWHAKTDAIFPVFVTSSYKTATSLDDEDM
ncbi:MAG: hypothetical protein AB2693_21170 [Candidatus Thiodiazotropha sp.]